MYLRVCVFFLLMYEIIFLLNFVPFKFLKNYPKKKKKKFKSRRCSVNIYIYIIQKQKKVTAEGND